MAALKALIKLNRDNLQIFTLNKEPITVLLSGKAVDDLELKDYKNLNKEIVKAIVSNKLNPKKALIVLGEDLLFTKTTNAKTEESRNKIISDFLDEIPFEPNTIVHKNFKTSKGVKIVAANNSVFMGVIKSLEDQKWIIKYVVPESITGKNFDKETLKTVFRDKKKLSLGNFYTFENKEIHSGWKIGLGISLTLSLLGVAFYFVANAPDKVIPEEIHSIEQPIDNVVEEVIEIVEEPKIAKADITIQILNGTGLPGQAGKTGKILEELEYEKIELGNAETSDYLDTQLIYTDNIPEDYLEEIGDSLKEIYMGIVETPADEDDNINYNIVIITGNVITK